MTNKISNIAKNTSYFTFALILQKVVSFTYFVIIAKALLPEDLGKYYFAISFTTIFAIFIDLGLANVLTREVAKSGKDNEQVKAGPVNLLGSVLAIKLPLAAISIISAFILVNVMGYAELTKQLVYLSSICMVLDSFTLTFFAVIRGFHNLGFESISSVIFQLIVLGFGYLVLKLNLGLRWLVGSLVIASSFNFIYSFLLLRFKWKIKIKPIRDKDLIKMIISIAIPFALFGVFQRLYMYLDSVLLASLAGERHVGLYQIAFKIIFALQFLPMAFVASLYPAFSAYWKNNKEQLSVTFERALAYLIIISLPISVGIISLSDKIILFFNPEYAEAIWPLRIIMISLIFIFLNFPIGSLLNACDRQRVNTKNMAIALAASIIMNIILIPKMQSIGASITVIATNFFMFILGMIEAPKIVKYKTLKVFFVFLKSLISTALMAIFIFYFKDNYSIFLLIFPAGIIYFSALFLLGGFKKEDLFSILKSFKK